MIKLFDQQARLQSDSASVIRFFAQLYPRLQAPPDVIPHVTHTLFINSASPRLILDDDVYPLHRPEQRRDYLLGMMFKAVVDRVRSHFLIHAGVVAYQGQAVLLVADSFHGKTTLTLELLRRGLDFLSDEFAALKRDTPQVHAFPRTLRVRPGTLELTGLAHLVPMLPVWCGKYLLDVAQVRSDCLARQAAIDHIIVFSNPDVIAPPERELGLIFDTLDEPLQSAIAALPQVEQVWLATESDLPLLWLRADHRIEVLDAVTRLCRERRILLLDVIKRRQAQPDFSQPAQLTPLPVSQTVLELLRRFEGGHQSALLQAEFGGSSSRLFFELSGLISQARCHRLTVGPLTQMADLVCDLVGKP